MHTSLALEGGSDRASLGRLLVNSGAITSAQLEVTLRQERQLASQGRSVRLEELLVRNRFTTQAQIHDALAAGRIGGDVENVEALLSPASCSKYQVIPVSSLNGVLTVKSARPLRASQVAAILQAASGRCSTLRVVCADMQEMHNFLSKQMAHDSFESMLERLRPAEHSVSLVRLAIEALLHEAIDMRCSDIHMDVKPSRTRGSPYESTANCARATC